MSAAGRGGGGASVKNNDSKGEAPPSKRLSALLQRDSMGDLVGSGGISVLGTSRPLT